jgi:hypothetical protein
MAARQELSEARGDGIDVAEPVSLMRTDLEGLHHSNQQAQRA